MNDQKNPGFANSLISAACLASVVGIWPRFIEPRRVTLTRIPLPLQNFPSAFQGLKILQLSDLHFHPSITTTFLERIVTSARSVKPDIIVFTGDFLCDSTLTEPDRFCRFLCELQAPHGCFAILGNHDYAKCVELNQQGEYDLQEKKTSVIGQTLKRLFTNPPPSRTVTKEAKLIAHHPTLSAYFQQTPFTLLHNTTHQISVRGSTLNITGLGEYMLGRCLPEIAFETYDHNYPGIVLTHNPDSFPSLRSYPGNLILAGHTHGGQIYLPWIWKKIAMLENPQFRYGLHEVDGKHLFITRGLGGTFSFRLFCPPELALITLGST